MNLRRRSFLATALVAAGPLTLGAQPAPGAPQALSAQYRERVDLRLAVPAAEVARYARLAEAAFARVQRQPTQPQYLLLVDRDPWVQAALLLWRSAAGAYVLVGASPVSTGRTGGADPYDTPLGVFAHGPDAQDFRSDGAPDAEGVRPYGERGMRVFDFGWQPVPPGWGPGNVTRMRLLVHATDPEALERRLGSAQSEGTIRLPGTLNRLLDERGVLDDGRFLVVVESGRSERPDWSPAPYLPHRRPVPPQREPR